MTTELNHQYSQSAIIQLLKTDLAVLKLADGQVMEWKLDLLPKSIKQGDEVRVIVHDSKTDEEERHRLARAIVNEIIASKS